MKTDIQRRNADSDAWYHDAISKGIVRMGVRNAFAAAEWLRVASKGGIYVELEEATRGGGPPTIELLAAWQSEEQGWGFTETVDLDLRVPPSQMIDAVRPVLAKYERWERELSGRPEPDPADVVGSREWCRREAERHAR